MVNSSQKRLAVLQINGAKACPVWAGIAAKYNFDTIWLDTRTDAPDIDITTMQPDLVLIQCYVQWMAFSKIGWNTLRCPIIASCGDALCVTNIDAVLNNLPHLARLHVEGADYLNVVQQRCPEHIHKLQYQHLCNDRLFPRVEAAKEHDWCFLGQLYQEYDVRLKHYRQNVILDLIGQLPNCVVGGSGWDRILPTACPHMPQEQLNAYYAKCHAVVSVDAHDGSGYTSTRTIEAMHAGHCTMIYDHAGMPYLKQFIQDGVHAYYFRTASEFVEKLEHLKADPQFAQHMRQNGSQLIRELGWTVSAWYESAAHYVSTQSSMPHCIR